MNVCKSRITFGYKCLKTSCGQRGFEGETIAESFTSSKCLPTATATRMKSRSVLSLTVIFEAELFRNLKYPMSFDVHINKITSNFRPNPRKVSFAVVNYLFLHCHSWMFRIFYCHFSGIDCAFLGAHKMDENKAETNKNVPTSNIFGGGG